MPTYNRSTTVDPLPGGDSVKQACIDLDTDLTGAFTGLNTLDTGKAPLASPALTGTPTAPTATAGTNTTQVATTAFVKALGDTKSPMAGPGAAQAFEVGALTAGGTIQAGSVVAVGETVNMQNLGYAVSTPPADVGYIYMQGGALKFISANGTVTTMAPL